VIRTPHELQSYVSIRFRSRDTCRVFHDALNHCWPLPEEDQGREIAAFAAQHGWTVEVHQPAELELVADFGITR
jgi:hypothetical protein